MKLSQMLKVEANSLHNRFIEALRLLEQSMEPSARSLHLDDLSDLLDRARQLLSFDELDGLSRSRLLHMTARDVSQYAALAKYNDRKDLIVSTAIR